MYNVQDYSVSSVLCEDWHFTRMWKALAWPLFIEVSVPSQKSERSCIRVLEVLILHLSAIFQLDFKLFQLWCFGFFHFIVIFSDLLPVLMYQ
jgi:hypothetical protein